MKKNLLVLLVVGLMVALLGAPALAADDGHDGHVDGHGEVVITQDDVTEALEDAEEMTSADVSEESSNFETLEPLDLGDVDSDDPIFVNAVSQIFDTVSGDASVSDVEILVGAFHATIASDETVLTFASNPTELTVDQVFLLVSPDWVEAELSGDTYSLGAAALSAAATNDIVLEIADNSSADMNPASSEVDFAFLAVHEDTASSSSGGGCNVASIAPLAGLLVLPLLMLVKR